MLKHKLSIFSLVALFGIAFATEPNSNWQDDYSSVKYISASSIEKLGKDTSSVLPKVNSKDAYTYLNEDGPLGRYGPLSSNGPLAKIYSLKTDSKIKKNKNLEESLQDLKSIKLPIPKDYLRSSIGNLSEYGPLSFAGPYAPDNYYYGELFAKNEYAAQLRAFGLWAAVGTLGPLGTIGALGPLGPAGDHGYTRDKQGNYVDKNGKIVSEIDVPFDNNSTRTFDLYEFYATDYAASKKDLDTSFVTLGSLKDNYSDDYMIHSDKNEIVTIVVVPKYMFNNFDIELHNSKGKLIAKSDSHKYINFIQFLSPKDNNYIIKVTSPDKSDKYALYVTGSTEYLNKYNASGDHIIKKIGPFQILKKHIR